MSLEWFNIAPKTYRRTNASHMYTQFKNLISRTFGRSGKTESRNQSTSIKNQTKTMSSFRGLHVTTSGVNISEDTVVSWTAIWRGLQLMGMAIGSLPFSVIEKDGKGTTTKLVDHPLWPIISLEPHPFYSTFDYLQAIMYQVLLRGNAVIVINRNEATNRPDSLRLIKWQDVYDIIETLDGRLIYKIVDYPEPISHEDIIHIKGITKDGLVGLDTVSWNKESFGLALATKKSAADYHRKGTKSEGFLSTESTLDPDTRRKVTEAFRDDTAAGDVPFLTGGVSWQKMGISPKEIQLLEARQFNVYEAARLLGISPHLLYAMDRANFSNVETLSLEFIKFSLKFWVDKIEQEHSRKLFRSEEKGRICVDLDMNSYMRGDSKARAAYIKDLMDRGVMDIDEARMTEGFNIVGGDVGSTRFVPGGYQTVTALKKAEEEIGKPDPKPAKLPNEEEE